ncbi:MAG: pseudouridine synthase [Bacteroidota bacterium]|nr:pseudouridine synthase [Bacteroidota bacterium]
MKKRKESKQQESIQSFRLNQWIAKSGLCSRRKADELIQKGLVKVNGKQVLDMGIRVVPKDKVSVEGKTIVPLQEKVYIVMNKPKNTITSVRDEKGRQTVMELLAKAIEIKGLYPVGRLDRNTSGVLLITNDGEITNKLIHPSFKVKKVYKVTLNKPIEKHDFESITKGVMLDDGEFSFDKAAIINEHKTILGVELHSGKNRIVRRTFEALGYSVKQLDRVYFAGLDKKRLRPGQYRNLRKKEILALKTLKK